MRGCRLTTYQAQQVDGGAWVRWFPGRRWGRITVAGAESKPGRGGQRVWRRRRRPLGCCAEPTGRGPRCARTRARRQRADGPRSIRLTPNRSSIFECGLTSSRNPSRCRVGQPAMRPRRHSSASSVRVSSAWQWISIQYREEARACYRAVWCWARRGGVGDAETIAAHHRSAIVVQVWSAESRNAVGADRAGVAWAWEVAVHATNGLRRWKQGRPR